MLKDPRFHSNDSQFHPAPNSDSGHCFSHSLAELAHRQGGHVTTAQLHALGLTDNSIGYQVRRGRLLRVFQGVYAVGHLPTQPLDRAQGALLACGPRSALGGGSAAAFWDVRREWPDQFEVVSAVDRRPRGLRVILARNLITRDVRRVDGIRVTSPARTLLDSAPGLSRRQLLRAVEDLRLRRRLTAEQLTDVVARNRHHPGAPLLRPLLATIQPEPTRSELEDAFQELIRKYDLPRPLVNVRVGGHRVDAFFESAQLIVELDGWATHGTRRAFANDRARMVDVLVRTGIPTIRFTYAQTTVDAAKTASQLRALLDRTARVGVQPSPERHGGKQ